MNETLAWYFSAYKNELDYKNIKPFFVKKFSNFNEMKTFSAKHSNKYISKYPEYCANYIKK